MEINPIEGPLELFGARFEPVKVMHGDAEIHGYRFGSAAYLTDFSEIPAESRPQLAGLDILFLDALRHKPHPTHSTLENSLRLVEELKPRRAFFTHICARPAARGDQPVAARARAAGARRPEAGVRDYERRA